MRPQVNRLDAQSAKAFSGSGIDRSRPLRFRLDGRIISGFSGDTVLSALIASGVDTLGVLRQSPIGLTMGASPAIAYASLAADPQQALPMDRTPAVDGAELVILRGPRRRSPLSGLFQPGRSLGLKLDDPHALDRPWGGFQGMAGTASDVIVIGGGVAGMSAALAAARSGLSVILIEARPHLGGNSGLFGTQEGEDAPEANMARLSAATHAHDAITVLTRTRAFAMRPGLVRVHDVDVSGPAPQGRVRELEATHIVIATGSLERLPILPGNRLPGVMSSMDSYELAAHYGIWPGRSALVATSSSPAYRLAMLAQDAGIKIDRILDSRPRPNSRFVEFTKAYGIRQFPGTVPEAVATTTSGPLEVHFGSEDGPGVTVDRVVLCGGWQPNLTLWHVAGGLSQWSLERHRLEAQGSMENVVLAGSAAGYLTRRGCIQSGHDAMDQLLGRKRRPVDDPILDPLYETPDDPAPVSPRSAANAPAFLDHGRELLQRPAARKRSWRPALFGAEPSGLPALSEAPQPLAICDIAAGVDLGLIPADSAGIVAQERVALISLAPQLPQSDSSDFIAPALDSIPRYLAGRFENQALALLVPAETRLIETGALIYRSSDTKSPLNAIGVILRPCESGAVALVAGSALRPGMRVTVRDQGRPVPARLEKWTSGPALGGLAGAP